MLTKLSAALAWPVLGLTVGCAAAPAPSTSTPPATTSTAKKNVVREGCAPPTEDEPRIDFAPKPLMAICHGVYVDPAMRWEDRERVKTSYGDALEATATFFDAPLEPANAIVCSSDACAEAFAGPTRRSRATMQPRPTVIVNEVGPLMKGTLVHEMIHIEIARRFRDRKARRSLPTWFEEGVATFIGDNGQCTPKTPRAIDDLRRLSAPHVWTNFTNQPNEIEAAYCQVRHEIAAWSTAHDPRALVAIIDAVARGERFEQHYGPLAIAPGAPHPPEVVASFTFDEGSGDAPFLSPFLSGVARVRGHRGSGASVANGAYIRASGLADLGLPNTPFSIALWVKPRPGAKALVHAAKHPSGGNGWCLPLLGHDAEGRLVAQVPFDTDPDAFLSAIGPKLPPEAWSHVVMTWNADDGVRLYLDGKLVASRRPKNDAEHHRDAPGSPMHLFFGGQAGSACWSGALESGDYDGTLDDIRVFNYALTGEQVVAEAKR